MKRRDFLIATGSLAVPLPMFASAATPCPPPSVSTSSQSVVTACAPGANGTYTTNFPLTENPISEGSRWLGGSTNGLVFKNVRTTPGRAFASGINNSYDDSLAILNSPSISNDHYVEVVIHLESGYTAPSSHEVELQLRGNITANSAPLYEILVPFGGSGCDIFCQTGPMGGFEILAQTGPAFGRSVAHGDVIRAKIVGSVITVYFNGAFAATATDTRLTTGKPGMGFFVRPGGTPDSFCISSWSCGPAT